MENFLKCLLSLSVGGSLLALGLLLLGRVKKLPKSFLYYAWLLVLLRLAVPLPGNLTLTMPEPPGILVTSESGFPKAVYPVDTQWNEDALEPVETIPARPYLDVKETPDPIRPTYGTPGTMGIWQALGILWAMGFAFLAGRDVLGYFRFRHALNKTVLPPRQSDLDSYAPARRGPRLLRSSAIDTPMLMGVFRPVLVLPDRDYEGEILNCIFRHELTHFRRGDIVLKWLAMPILAAHWFNPLTVLIRREFHRSCELSCDERILKTMDHDQRKCYGETLLLMAQRGTPSQTALSTSFCAEKRNLKERLVHIMNFGPKSGWIWMVTALLLAAVLAACLALGPARKDAEAREEPLVINIRDGSYLSVRIHSMPAVYTGEPVHVQGSLEGSDDQWSDGIGLLLLLDGRPQPYRTGDSDELQYMHIFRQQGDVELIFNPVAGHEGETLDLAAFTVQNPDRCTTDHTTSSDHSTGSISALYPVIMKAEPGQTMVPDVPRREREVQINYEESSENEYFFRFIPGARLDGKQKLQARVAGPAGANLYYVIYLNNQPVAWEYIACPESRRQAVIDTTLDLRDFQGDGMVYAVLYGQNPNDPGDNFIDVSETFYLTATGADRAIPGATILTKAVLVSGVDEFLEAIGPDTTIVLEPGVYDLTTAKNYGKQHVSDYYRWDQVRDGYGLTIRNVDNLAILGGDQGVSEIVTQPRYAPVLQFSKCTDITIRSLTAGHTEGVEGCSGAVFLVNGTTGFDVRGCDLYGCGTYGVDADNCTKITVANSTIRDCSSGAASFTSCVDAFLYENEIYGIGELPADDATNRSIDGIPAALFQFRNSGSSAVLNCSIRDSMARKLLIADDSQQIYFMGNTGQGLDMREGVLSFRNGIPTVDGCQLRFKNETKWLADTSDSDYVYDAQGEKCWAGDLDGMKYRAFPMPLSEIPRKNSEGEQERLDRALGLIEIQ